MAKKAPAVPPGYHTVTPSLFVAGAARALDFYKKHGYSALGPVFEEAGMPHLEMHKKT